MKLVSLQEWNLIPPSIRFTIASILGVHRSLPTQVVSNQLVHDGISERDLANVTFESVVEAAQVNNLTLPQSFLVLAKEKEVEVVPDEPVIKPDESLTQKPYVQKKAEQNSKRGKNTGRDSQEGNSQKV